MCRKKDVTEEHGAFAYAANGHGEEKLKVKHLEALRKTARIWPPAVNQIELHPYNTHEDLVDYCRKQNIVVKAYASLGGQDCGKKTWGRRGGKLTEREEVIRMAEKYGKTPSQILLRWATDKGHVCIPKTGNIQHMRENIAAVMGSEWPKNGLDNSDWALLASLDQSKTDLEKARLCWVRDPLRHLDFA